MTYVDEYQDAYAKDDLTVYCSGPMTDLPGNNFEAFFEAEKLLRSWGYTDIVNPAEAGVIEGWSWSDYLRSDLAELVYCDAIYLLSGWKESKGARLEKYVAEQLGLVIMGEIDG